MKSSEQRIEIPLSKSKIILMFLGALTFVAIGIWFVIAPPKIENSYWSNPKKIAIAGYASIIFFRPLRFLVSLVNYQTPSQV
jgi:hypothetical protein